MLRALQATVVNKAPDELARAQESLQAVYASASVCG